MAEAPTTPSSTQGANTSPSPPESDEDEIWGDEQHLTDCHTEVYGSSDEFESESDGVDILSDDLFSNNDEANELESPLDFWEYPHNSSKNQENMSVRKCYMGESVRTMYKIRRAQRTTLI
jgi:hypothetical protein